MNINVTSSSIPLESLQVNNSKKILLAGEASSNLKAREIILPSDKKEALSLFGPSDLYNAFCLLKDLGVDNIYVSNCFSESDYIRLTDKIMHYDFDYFVPIGIYLSDKFYNPIQDTNQYYASYFLEQLSAVNSLTTVIMTERHASLYEDFDHYTISMSNIESEFISSYDFNNSQFLENSGNNLNFIYNNLNNVPYANVVLASLYYKRDYAKYFFSMSDVSCVYNIDSNDVLGLRAMYFKDNFYTSLTTVENAFNFKKTPDIYSNALIDDIIKRTIKIIDLDKFKGRLFNQYVSIQIQSEVNRKLSQLKGKLFKDFVINNISFKHTEPTAGYIVVNYSIKPYGTLETLNVVMGV